MTAAYGCEGFLGDHRRAFAKWGTERVLIAFDRDEAGDRAAEKLAAELEENGIATARVVFPKGMDANEYALRVHPAEKSLGLVLRQAEWLGSGKPAVIVESVEPPPATTEVPEPAQGDAGDVAELDEAEAGAARDEQSEPEGAERGTTVDPPRSDVSESEHLPSLAAELPAAPEPELAGDDLVFHFGDRRWRVRGFSKNTGSEQLRVNLHVSRPGGAFHVDTVELYSARQRAVFTKQASDELGVEERVVKRELGAVLLKLEERQEAEKKAAEGQKQRPEMTDVERQDALELLRDPQLFERLLADFRRCGVVGEETNKLVGYLAATSLFVSSPKIGRAHV